MSNIANNLYKGSIEYGRFTNTLSSIVMIIIAIIAIIFGIYLIFNSIFDKRKEKIIGTIVKTSCNSFDKRICEKKDHNCKDNCQESCTTYTSYRCQNDLKYTVNEKDYTTRTETITETPQNVGIEINLLYEKNNPSNVKVEPTISSSNIGLIIIAIMTVVIVYNIAKYYLVQRSDLIASFEGVNNFTSLFKRRKQN